MIHCMIDLESLGNTPNAVVLSVAMVAFTRESIVSEKEWYLDVNQQISQGRRIDYDAICWWMNQSDSAKKVFNPSFKTSLSFFVGEVIVFFNRFCGADGRVWGNGASFDIPIVETLMKRNMTEDLPWKFWNHRCYRTLKPLMDKTMRFEGEKHHALSDAKHQVKSLQELWTRKPELET